MSMDQPRPRSKEKLSSLLKVKSCNTVTLANEEIFFLPISHVALLVYDKVKIIKKSNVQ